MLTDFRLCIWLTVPGWPRDAGATQTLNIDAAGKFSLSLAVISRAPVTVVEFEADALVPKRVGLPIRRLRLYALHFSIRTRVAQCLLHRNIGTIGGVDPTEMSRAS